VNDGTGRSGFLVDYGWGLWLGLIILNQGSFGFRIFLCVLQLTVEAASESAIWEVGCILLILFWFLHLYLFSFLVLILDPSDRRLLLDERLVFLATRIFRCNFTNLASFSFAISSFSLFSLPPLPSAAITFSFSFLLSSFLPIPHLLSPSSTSPPSLICV
jgi:hypothetical protein